MSFFLPDRPEDKPKKKSYTGPTNYFTGLPTNDAPRYPEAQRPQRRPVTNKQAAEGMRSFAEGYRGIYDTGKAIYDIAQKNRPKNRYLNRPGDYDKVLEKAKLVKQREKEAQAYHKAKADIQDYEQRRQEYEASQPKKGIFRRMFGR